MAIITCPECGQKVSSTAPACPACGHAVAQALKYKARQQGCGALALVVGAVLVMVVIAGGDKPKPGDASKPASVPDPPRPMTGQTWYAKGSPIGCRDSKDLDRLGSLARQDDKEAFARFYMRQALAGQCTHIDEGASVYIESTSIFGSPCVRPKGDPFCLFVLPGFLQNAPVPK